MAQEKSKQIMIRVTPDTKEKWEKAAESGGFTGFSDFIRFAVNNEIEGREQSTDGTNIDTEEIADAVEDVIAEHTSDIERRLSAINAAIDGIQHDLDSDGEGTVAVELIFENLPTQDETPKPPEEVADLIGVPTAPVRRTLERLVLESERIQTVEYEDGNRGYYKDV